MEMHGENRSCMEKIIVSPRISVLLCAFPGSFYPLSHRGKKPGDGNLTNWENANG
jgi:hypothetical protein